MHMVGVCFHCRLYKSLGDFDVLQGIFSSKVGTHELTQRAMEEEMKRDYKAALKLYNEVRQASLK